MYRHILPEIALSRRDMSYYDMSTGQHISVPASSSPPAFPATCPACQAPKTAEVAWRSAAYACGAAYTSKPQIQNHTDKWWGVCPATTP